MGKFYIFKDWKVFYLSFLFIFTSSTGINNKEIDSRREAIACAIENILIGELSCNNNGTYQILLTVQNNGEDIPEGNLNIEAKGTTFVFPVTPSVTEEQVSISLPYDGMPVDLVAYYSEDPDCRFELPDAFISPVGCSSISGRIWIDENFDGIFDGNENGVSGYKVALLDCSNLVIQEQNTDETGEYLFDFLPQGDYKIKCDLPEDGKIYEFSPAFQSVDFLKDSDVGENGISSCFSLAADQHKEGINAGIIICPASISIVCNDVLNVPVDDECEMEITPEMIIGGSDFCISTLEVKLFDDTGFIGNTVGRDQVGKTVTAIVVNKQNENNFCSAKLNVFDNIAPDISCTSDVHKAFVEKEVTIVDGMLEENDAQFSVNGFTCWLGEEPIERNLQHYYDTQNLTVNKDDYYFLVLFTDWGDGAGAIVEGEFDNFNPCRNIQVFANSASGNLPVIDLFDNFGNNAGGRFEGKKPVLKMALPMRKGKNYQLVTSSYAPIKTGSYFWAIFSDTAGQILNNAFVNVDGNIGLDLICTDFDSVFNHVPSLSKLGFPEVADNCTELNELKFVDVIQRKSVCGPVLVDRTFTAKDESGNTSSCVQQLTIRKPGKNDLILPTATVFLDCDDQFIYDERGNPHPDMAGHPLVWTAYGVKKVSDPLCNLVADYSDEIKVNVCEGVYTIRREWTIIDWCNVSNTLIYNQIINVEDNDGPDIDLETIKSGVYKYPDTLFFSTGPFDCTSSFQVPIPGLTDNCSGSPALAIEILSELLVNEIDHGVAVGSYLDTQVIYSIPVGKPPVVTGIPLGCHWIRYIATDDCGNESSKVYPFCVEDYVEPIVICVDNVSVSIGGQSVARLFAENVDQGSFDACEMDKMEIRRAIDTDQACNPSALSYSSYGSFVDFNCCDVGKTILVELKVTDKAGNFNSCWLNVDVKDKIIPQCQAPNPITVRCDQLPYDFDPENLVQLQSLFGTPSGSDNCEIEKFEELSPVLDLDDCLFGSIVRKFRVFDKAGNVSTNVCEQKVTILPYYDYSIKFPKDLEISCGTLEADTIEVFSSSCDLLAIRTKDEIFSASADEGCYKIFRTYSVINWCEYVDTAEPLILKRDEDCDGKVGDEDVWVVRRTEQAFIDRDNNERNDIPKLGTKGTTCDGSTNPKGYWRTVTSSGYWEYTQVIKVRDTEAPALTYEVPEPFCSINNETCNASVKIAFELDEICSPSEISIIGVFDANNDGVPDEQVTVKGAYPNYSIEGDFPIGSHVFEIFVEDGCNNKKSYDLPFSVVDCKAPGIICISSITTSLSLVPNGKDIDGDGEPDRGMSVLRASDFISGILPDCSGALQYSINRRGEIPNPEQDSIILTCKDSTFANLEIYVWDNADNPKAIQPDGSTGGPNYNFCNVFVNIEDNFGLCRSVSGMISGMITTPENKRINGVEVKLSGEMETSFFTESNGLFEFDDLPEGVDYSITPFLDEKHNNGVTTFDLIIISKHILGVAPITSPYKLIAADADNSKNISTLDLIRLRKLILGVETRLSKNSSWRFVAANYDFPFDDDPWFEDFPEVVSVNNLAGIVENLDFMAMKIGDVNNSASLINTSLLPVETRSNEEFKILVDQENINVGELVNVTFTSRELPSVQGFQFTLKFDPYGLSLEKTSYGLLQEGHLGQNMASRGLLTTSWNGNLPLLQEGEEVPLFSLTFKAKQSGKLLDLLAVTSDVTIAEAYKNNGNMALVVLDYQGTVKAGTNELHQNFPNPAKDLTRISFNLVKSEEVKIKIFDKGGHLVNSVAHPGNAGYNEILIQTDRYSSGLYTYQLEGTTFRLAKKMMIIR